MEINEQLRILYEKEIERLVNKIELPQNINGPQLMYCWEDVYLRSKFKILFIGQEPEERLGGLNLKVSERLKRYKDFDLGKKGQYSPFWQYVYDTKNLLMPKTIGQNNFLWTNVSKFSRSIRGSKINSSDFKFFSANFDVLEREIKITDPDVIIFFTGPDWDEKIQYQISDKIKFSPISYEIDKSELARLSAKPFPLHTYRVLPPAIMHAQKKEHYMSLIIRNIRFIKARSKEEVRINIGVNELIRELSEKMAKVNEIKRDLVKSHKYGQASEVRDIEILFQTSIDKLEKILESNKKA